MTTWNLPTDEHTAEWAELITKDFLGRRGCDESCRSMGAHLSRELVDDALPSSQGTIRLGIECSPGMLVVSTSAVPSRPRSVEGSGPPHLRNLVRSCTRTYDESSGRTETVCEFRCIALGAAACHVTAPSEPGDTTDGERHATV
jgi:hypothetical protein